MRGTATSHQPPPRYEIIHRAGEEVCGIVFYLDTRAEEDGEDVIYSSRVLRLTVRWEPGLLQDVRDRYGEWVALAETEGE